MSVRDDIMDNLQAALEAILDVGDPVPDAGNSTPPISLSVTSSGSFTESAAKTYTIEIVTGGGSGTAECTITDVVGNQTITSGVDLNLGTGGGKIRFTFATTDVLTLGDKWTVSCDTYNSTVRQVLRLKATGITLKEYPTILIARGDQDYGQPDGTKYANKMRVFCEAWIEERTNIDDDLEKMLEDMENAIQLDSMRGGYAQDTIFIRSEPGVPEQGRPYGVMSLEIQIMFNQIINP